MSDQTLSPLPYFWISLVIVVQDNILPTFSLKPATYCPEDGGSMFPRSVSVKVDIY